MNFHLNEEKRGVVALVLRLLAAAGCVAVIVIAHGTVSWVNLAIMLAGLAGLIVLLAQYNRKYR